MSAGLWRAPAESDREGQDASSSAADLASGPSRAATKLALRRGRSRCPPDGSESFLVVSSFLLRRESACPLIAGSRELLKARPPAALRSVRKVTSRCVDDHIPLSQSRIRFCSCSSEGRDVTDETGCRPAGALFGGARGGRGLTASRRSPLYRDGRRLLCGRVRRGRQRPAPAREAGVPVRHIRRSGVLGRRAPAAQGHRRVGERWHRPRREPEDRARCRSQGRRNRDSGEARQGDQSGQGRSQRPEDHARPAEAERRSRPASNRSPTCSESTRRR